MSTNTRKSAVTDTQYAWRVATNPRRYSKSNRKLLINRAIDKYYTTENGEITQTQLLDDVGKFVRNALEQPRLKTIVTNPPELITQPAKAAILMALGSILSNRHNVIQKDPRDSQIQTYVRDYYRYILFAAAKHSTYSKTIQKEIGTAAYSREQEDEYGPPPGETIEDITEIDGLSGKYFKIPLVHANRYCISREKNGNTTTDITCIIKGPYVYLPVSDAQDKYSKNEFSGYNGVAQTLEKIITLSISDDRLNQYQQEMTGLNERIEQLHAANSGVLFKERQYPAKLEAILQAIDEADSEKAAIGDKLTAKETYNVIQEYGSKTNTDWIRNTIDSITSPKSLSQQLSKYASDDDIRHVSVEKRQGKSNLYKFEYTINGVKKIEVTEISDLLELPCIDNLHESLQNGKPVRWELYSFVRYVFEINSVEFGVEDIKQWFSQYDWYREEVTEYQANYEQEQRMADGERPLPISCRNDNDNWAKHCIGIENCDYSLYRSVELRPDIYDRISSD